ncbi:MAG: F0F1 ATP synthase subunit epsilon [Bacteroidales bacterium]|jgi:F-type H+-transporting ATPase subunit epsilon|nr:F0F1 ATP synthase subunit epsilon [Bacteroidales bacterium]
MELYLNVTSFDEQLFKGKVNKVLLPGTLGPFTILPHHAPIISSLTSGNLEYVDDEGTHSINIPGGFVEYSDGKVTVCTAQLI